MKIVLGVDCGGSTTKIVAFTEDKKYLLSKTVKADDQITSLYGAIGNILNEINCKLGDVKAIIITGVGSSYINSNIYDIQTYKVQEFESIGYGGLNLSGLDKALVISIGTGTAFVEASSEKITHIGGSGVGGGTLIGLSTLIMHQRNIDAIVELSKNGDLDKVDLTIGDISVTKIPSLPDHATAANFAKISSTVKNEDVALGLINLLFQTIGMMAVFAVKSTDIKDIVITGSVATLPQSKTILKDISDIYHLNFIIPDNSMFATAIGATELYFKGLV